ncbi:MAG: hypothetical protein KKE73_00145 [Proteobacteria bacterium]|nr:hypothetical protein [Pseudomonadota bacterium]
MHTQQPFSITTDAKSLLFQIVINFIEAKHKKIPHILGSPPFKGVQPLNTTTGGNMPQISIVKKTNIHSFLSFQYPHLNIRDGPGEAKVNCPAHEDNKPSCSMNLTTGLWFCHSCGAKGDLIDFYRRLHGVDFSTAINKLNQQHWRKKNLKKEQSQAASVIHNYHNADGTLSFEVLRELDEHGQTQGIKQRRPDGNGGYIYNLWGGVGFSWTPNWG